MLLLLACAHQAPPQAAAVTTYDPAFTGIFSMPGADVQYYMLDARTLGDARAQMDSAAPADGAGARHQGLTSWKVGWEASDDSGACVVTTTRVVWVDLPRWESEAAAEPWERALWQKQVLALVEHERGHVDLALAFFADLDARLSARGCADVAGNLAVELADLAARQEALHRATSGAPR
jgi:predicted secreted Zn-dependent protease